jgi:mxaJ protein
MYLRCLSLLAFPTLVLGADLRVCAEPDNLPFSHRDQSGFENRTARLLAEELGRELVYSWNLQRRAFVRKTFGSGLCDVWMGVPAGFERTLTTKPYYRSTYVFVHGKRPLRSFDEPQLKHLRIGVQLPGDDGAATPPGHVLAAKGIKVDGFPIYGELPVGQRMVEAVARGDLDAVVVWGPAAGFFARRKQLQVAPASAPPGVEIPFQFEIAIGVRRGERALRDELNAALERRRDEIEAVLDHFAVPRVR